MIIINEKSEQFDEINRPSHYCEGRKYEPIDVIEDWELDFLDGQVVKYMSRAGRKESALKDYKKAAYYLGRKIARLESNNG